MMRLSDLYGDQSGIRRKENSFLIETQPGIFDDVNQKKRIHLLALGDVGSMLLIGLRLLGGDAVASIGICDVRPEVTQRFEREINQIGPPLEDGALPEVDIVDRARLFDCDMVVFCASKGVPPIGETAVDVRMAQMEENAALVAGFARDAVRQGFRGKLAMVSDPVDPLCKAAYLQGLRRDQIQGYGLGVMNSRALYFAKKDDKFQSFLKEGRAFGPHGEDLVIANSIEHYDAGLSLELTGLAVNANLEMRRSGFKPYIAPALSSGALSILAALRGKWNYSSVYFGEGARGAFLGVKNRWTRDGAEVEDLPLPEELYRRIKAAYDHLAALN